MFQVTGSDSVQTSVYRGSLFWFWGDTNRPRYPLGNFNVPGATSRLPADGGLDPDKGVNLDYFTDDEGFARQTCKMPGDGPTWLDALITLRLENDKEALYGAYYKIRGSLTAYQRGLVHFDDMDGKRLLRDTLIAVADSRGAGGGAGRFIGLNSPGAGDTHQKRREATERPREPSAHPGCDRHLHRTHFYRDRAT